MPGAVQPFRRLLKRNNPQPTDRLFPGSQRELLNTILDEENLKIDREGQRRTAYSLRHTYICFRLMEGADIYQIAKNCRTSVEMIERITLHTLRRRSMPRPSMCGRRGGVGGVDCCTVGIEAISNPLSTGPRGGIGRRAALKMPFPKGVGVRFPPRAPDPARHRAFRSVRGKNSQYCCSLNHAHLISNNFRPGTRRVSAKA